MDDGVGVAFWELEDVGKVGAAPRVDRLGVVADHHDVAVCRGERVNEPGLQPVGVLILVHEDGSETALVGGGDLRMGEEKFMGLGEKVVEIEGVHLLFPALVGRRHPDDLILEVDEVAVTPR